MTSPQDVTESPWVFVSHSRFDDEGRLFIHDLFRGSKFHPDFYPLENPGPPHALPIRDRVARAASLFLVLSPPMVEKPHTRAWVGYEVGIAADRGIPVVVIEPEGTVVDLHVPGATHYIRRPHGVLDGLSPAWKHIAASAGDLVDSEPASGADAVGEKILEFLYNVANADKDSSGLFTRVRCDHADCRTPFYVPDGLYGAARIPCPSRRRTVASLRVKLVELSEQAAEEQRRRGPKSTPPRRPPAP